MEKNEQEPRPERQWAPGTDTCTDCGRPALGGRCWRCNIPLCERHLGDQCAVCTWELGDIGEGE